MNKRDEQRAAQRLQARPQWRRQIDFLAERSGANVASTWLSDAPRWLAELERDVYRETAESLGYDPLSPAERVS